MKVLNSFFTKEGIQLADAHGKDAQRHCDEGHASENPITPIRMATMETQKADGGRMWRRTLLVGIQNGTKLLDIYPTSS